MKFAADRPFSDPEKAAKLRSPTASRRSRTAGSISRKSTGHSFSAMAAARPNTKPASTWARARLAGNARERNLRQVHAGGRGSVCLNEITRAVAPAEPIVFCNTTLG